MSSILYGNLRIEVRDDAGARVDRLTMYQPLPSLTARPILARESAPALLLGRDEQLDQVRRAVQAQRPIEFNATCGYGKSTLLRYVAASAGTDGIAGSSVYLHVGHEDVGALLQHLVEAFYTADQRVKPMPDQCAQLLGQVRALVVLDDVLLDREQIEYVLRVLPGCSLVFSSLQPVLGRYGSSHSLAGLPDDAALQLVARDLGRPLTSLELAAVKRLAAAVDGQPLHLRQAAALVREDQLSFAALASKAEHNPDVLDRLSVNALAEQERRALAVLALAAGALLPKDLVAAMGDIAQVGEILGFLHRRGLAEQRDDRFGLPACKTEGYRQMLLKDLNRAAALREFVGWLATRDPTGTDATSAVGAALAIIGLVAERRDWPAVVRLVRVAEPILTLAGRWEASRRALEHGLQAARATGDQAAEALFSHQKGTLALCRDELTAAKRLLEHALELRERLGDREGAAVTRHNLQLLQPPPPPPPPGGAGHRWRRVAVAVGGALAVLLLVVGVVTATTSSPTGSAAASTTVPPVASATQPTSSTPSGGTSATTSQPSGPSGGGSTGSGTTAPAPKPPSLPTRTDFGSLNITPGQPPATQSITVSNPNAQPLPVTGADITGDPAFSVADDSCSGSAIPPRTSCSVTVRFAPTALGDQTGALTVASAAGRSSTTELAGTGFVELRLTVTGTGTVQDGRGRTCPPECITQITAPDQSSITLTETPGTGNYFVGWEGPCSNTKESSTCSLKLTADTEVRATFNGVVK
jgi:hypothetical protein